MENRFSVWMIWQWEQLYWNFIRLSLCLEHRQFSVAHRKYAYWSNKCLMLAILQQYKKNPEEMINKTQIVAAIDGETDTRFVNISLWNKKAKTMLEIMANQCHPTSVPWLITPQVISLALALSLCLITANIRWHIKPDWFVIISNDWTVYWCFLGCLFSLESGGGER